MLFRSLRNLLSPEKRLRALHNPSVAISCSLSGREAYANFFLLKWRVTLDLEDVLCSKTRMRILKLLFKLGQLNTSDLAHRLGANYATTLRHLFILKKEDIVTERFSGRTRFFRLTSTSKARATMRLLEEWEK